MKNPFKVGDVVICIDADQQYINLELNKEYKVLETKFDGIFGFVKIKESGSGWLYSSRFVNKVNHEFDKTLEKVLK